MNTQKTPTWLRGPGEVAAYLRCSRRWVEKVIADGNGPPCYRIAPRLRVFNPSEIDAWIREHGQGAG